MAGGGVVETGLPTAELTSGLVRRSHARFPCAELALPAAVELVGEDKVILEVPEHATIDVAIAATIAEARTARTRLLIGRPCLEHVITADSCCPDTCATS